MASRNHNPARWTETLRGAARGWLLASVLLAQAGVALGWIGGAAAPAPSLGPPSTAEPSDPLAPVALAPVALAPVSSAPVSSALAPTEAGEPTRAAASSPAAEPTLERFVHGKHVAVEWWRGGNEAAQDCRGCHTFDVAGQSGPTFVDSEQCYLCHLPGIAEVSRDEEARGTRDESRTRFRHHEHLGLECAKCHRPDEAGAERFELRVPEEVDLGFCMSCHGSGFDWRALSRPGAGEEGPQYRLNQRTAAQMGALLDDGLRRRSEAAAAASAAEAERPPREPVGGLADRRFSHVHHLDVGQELEAESCSACHVLQPDPGAPAAPDGGGVPSFRTMEVVVEDCTRCHLGVDFSRIPAAERAPSSAGFTFDHSRHTEVACTECHALDRASGSFLPPAPEGAEVPAGPVGAAVWYPSCVRCHEGSGSERAPRGVEAHGEGSHRRCVACHSAPEGSRPDAPVWTDQRPAVQLLLAGNDYLLPSVTHGFPGEGAALQEEECRECHKAPLRAGAERPVRFSHGDHLALETLEAEACRRCHDASHGGELASGANDAASLALAQDEIRTFLGQDSCQECHLGMGSDDRRDTSPAEDAGAAGHARFHAGPAESEERSFARFSHGIEGHEQDCSVCHEVDGGRSSGLGLTEKGADCAQCHGHGEEDSLVRRQRVPGLEDARSCVTCHARGIPEVGLPPAAPGPRLTIDATDMRHGRDEGMACSECHRGYEPGPTQPWQDSESWTLADAGAGGPRFRSERSSRFTLTAGKDKNPHQSNSDEHEEARSTAGEAVLADLGLDAPLARSQQPGDPFFQWLMPERAEGELNGQRCLHCHWNSIDSPEKLGGYQRTLWQLGATPRKNYGRPLDATWALGLAGVVAPHEDH